MPLRETEAERKICAEMCQQFCYRWSDALFKGTTLTLTEPLADFDAHVESFSGIRFVIEVKAGLRDDYNAPVYWNRAIWIKERKVRAWRDLCAEYKAKGKTEPRFIYIVRFADHRTFWTEITEKLLANCPLEDESRDAREDGEGNTLYYKLPIYKWNVITTIHLPSDNGGTRNLR